MHFHISTQDLCDVVVEVDKATKSAQGKSKTRRNVVLDDAESEEDDKEEARDEIKSNIEDFAIVDVE